MKLLRAYSIVALALYNPNEKVTMIKALTIETDASVLNEISDLRLFKKRSFKLYGPAVTTLNKM